MFKLISKRIVISLVAVIALMGLFKFVPVQAAAVDVFGGKGTAVGSTLGLGNQDPRVTAVNVIRIGLGFLGIIAIAIIMYAGWLWMTAGGEAQNIDKAKKILIGAVIGLLIILSSLAIATFIINSWLAATGANTGNTSTCTGPGCVVIPPVGPCTDGDTTLCGCSGTATCTSGTWGACIGSTCGAGISCNGTTTPGVCLPTSFCGTGFSCNNTSCFCEANLGAVGDPCSATSTPGVCLPDSTKCDGALTCDATPGPTACTCQGAPVIDWLSPVDNQSVPIPNGAPGNFVTIGGRFFGTTTGQVYFANGAGVTSVLAPFPNSVNAQCTNFWTDNHIIVVVPAGANTGAVRVVTAAGKEDTTNDSRGNKVPATNLATTEGKFVVNATARPGLCLATPDNGKMTDPFVLQGTAFAGASRTVKFGNEISSTSANVVVFAGSNKSVSAQVPNITEGGNTVFASVNGQSSNVLPFTVNVDLVDKPIIDYLDPAQGPVGQYVTIFGSKFLDFLTGSSTVKFHDIVANVDKFADVTFPDACKDNWWHDTYIIVKVPAGISIGNAQVLVTNKKGKTSDPADFKVTAGQPGPGLCAIDPENGDTNQAVEASGDHFGAARGAGYVRFFNNITASTYTGWAVQSVKTAVPADAITGAVRVIRNPAGATDLSNALPFRVGKCIASTECSAGKECCKGGSWDGICRTSGSCGAGNAASSTYGWTFSTGNPSAPVATCAGYSTANACMAAGSCPNSPGQCQSSTVGAVGDCGTTYCKTKYSACATEPSCAYDSAKNLCSTNLACNEGSDISGAISKVYTGENLSDFTPNPTAIELDGANKVYAYVGKNHWDYSTEYIPVDSSRTYLISARFRSLGAGSSVTFLGFQPFDINKKQITAFDVIRYGSTETITAFNNTSITVAEAIGAGPDGSLWRVGGVDQAHTRSLGFYYDGDITKIPDYVYYWTNQPFPISPYYNPAANQGAYSTAVGNTINLNNPIPAAVAAKIVLGTTKVKDHGSGGTFLYTGAAGASVTVADGWRELGGNIIGEAFGNATNKFRPGTKFVKLIYGVNHDDSLLQNGPSATKVWMDDLIFAPTSCNSVKGKDIFQIDTKGASCPVGSFLDNNNLCTLGTMAVPKTCSACPAGLACTGGKCAVKDQICKTGSSCDSTAGSPTENKCVSTAGTCDCCCRVAYSAQDCCPGLTCNPGGCGNDPVVYGQCSGCTVKISGVVDQALSNAACNCTGSSFKYCNAASVGGLGACEDAGAVGASCDGELPDNPLACVSPLDSKCLPGLTCDPASCLCKSTPTPTVMPCDSDTTNGVCDADTTLCPDPTTQICDASSCTCKTNTPVGSQCINVVDPICTVGAPTCGADYACLNKPGVDCRCCCDPAGPPNAAGLKCLPDKSPCDGGSRGLFCGCKADSECGAGVDGCGQDTCCRPRPAITSVEPVENAINVCRNPLIKVTFNQPMDVSSFSGNVIVAGEYAGSCPGNTTYLATIRKPQNIIAKTWQTIKSLFGGEAYAVDNFCAVTGTVSGSNVPTATSTFGVLNFSPQQILDPNTKYYVIIKGDASTTDSVAEGVRNSFKIGMDSVTTFQTFNGVKYNGKIWSFTTKPATAANKGVCMFDKVVMDPSGILFTKAGNATSTSATTTTAYAQSNDGNLIAPVAEYNWAWSWLAEDPTVATVSNTNNITQTITPGTKKDAKTIVRATALVTNDTVNKPSTKDQARVGKLTVRIFQCANPWPPITNPAVWPWQDANGNCSAGLGGTGCASNNFEFYYCRDNGQTGINDLPALGSNNSNTTSVIRGQENNLLKEYYFLRAVQKDSTGFNLSVIDLLDGGRLDAFWAPVAGATGYKLYYGDISGTYTKTIDTGAVTSAIISGLTNGKKYYFAFKSYDARKVESTISTEVSATPTDQAAPVAPTNFTATSTNSTVTLGWTKVSDAVKYKVYYGATTNYGSINDVNGATALDIKGLAVGNTYSFAVTAVDAAGNESVKSLATAVVK